MIKKIIIIIAIIAIGLVGWLFFRGDKESPYDTVVVKRGEIVQEVSGTGTVKPEEDVSLRFEASGTIDKIHVSEGEEVGLGDPLIKLYTGKIYSQYLQSKANYTEAKAQLDKLLAGASTQEIETTKQKVENKKTDLEDAKAKARVNLEEEYSDATDAFDNAYFNADKAIKKLETIFDENTVYEDFKDEFKFRSIELKSKTKDKKAKADAALNNLKDLISQIRANPSDQEIDNIFNSFLDNLKTIRDALDSAADLLDLAIVYSDYSSTQWDTDKSTIETGRTAINTAITNIVSAQQEIENQKITNQININSAESNLSEAKKELNELVAEPRSVEIAIYQAKVEKAKASLSEAQQKLNDATLNSPIDGTVAKIKAEIGEVVNAGEDPVITLIAPTKFKVEANIAETDIGKVDIGNQVKITLDAFPEKTWPGKVTEIEPAETVIEGVIYYKAKITFSKADEKVKSGMSADIDIITSRKNNVLYAPYRAVVYKNNKKIVRVVKNEEILEKEIKTGIKGTEGNVEILEGLKEGEEVITFMEEK